MITRTSIYYCFYTDYDNMIRIEIDRMVIIYHMEFEVS